MYLWKKVVPPTKTVGGILLPESATSSKVGFTEEECKAPLSMLARGEVVGALLPLAVLVLGNLSGGV